MTQNDPILARLNANYTHISDAWSRRATLQPRASASLADRPLGTRLNWELLNGADASSLLPVDAALGRLKNDRFDTIEQERFLISEQERDFTTGQEEVLALDWFRQVGVLNSTGFPPGGGGSPHFDCSIATPSGLIIACDVKTAGTTAFLRLQEALDPGTRQWSTTHSLSAHYRFTWTGPVSQASVGARFRQIREDWLNYTVALGPLLPTAPFSINLGAARVEVTLESSMTMWGGVSGLKAQTHAALDTLEAHVNSKAVHGHPFLLTYVRLPSRPIADLQPEPLRSALTTLHRRLSRTRGDSHQRWLGVVYVDLTGDAPNVSAFVRFNASWPAKSDRHGMASHLKAIRWKTRRR